MAGTILKPSLEDNINLVSKVLHRHISSGDGYLDEEKDDVLESRFDIDNFLKREYRISMGWAPVSLAGTVYKQRVKRTKCKIPSLDHIHKFMTLVFSKLELNVQCAIVGLLYCERLMQDKKIAMTSRNWRPILIVCLLLSSKMWDDISSWNVEFSELFPCLGLEQINYLEKLFLQEMGYDLFVSGSMYARYYFALRGLRYSNEHQIPRNYLVFKVAGQNEQKLGKAPNRKKRRNQLREKNRTPLVSKGASTLFESGSEALRSDVLPAKESPAASLSGDARESPNSTQTGTTLTDDSDSETPPPAGRNALPPVLEGNEKESASKKSPRRGWQPLNQGFLPAVAPTEREDNGRKRKRKPTPQPTVPKGVFSQTMPNLGLERQQSDFTGRPKEVLVPLPSRATSDPTLNKSYKPPSTNNLLRISTVQSQAQISDFPRGKADKLPVKKKR